MVEKLAGCGFVDTPKYSISQLDDELKKFILEAIDSGTELFRIETALERALNIVRRCGRKNRC